MSECPVTLFMFAGREGNMAVNLPLIRRILDENPRVRFDIWNLARTNEDSRYLNTIKGDRITVLNKFAGARASYRLNSVWRYYTDPRFVHHLFVKVDDDIVFIQTEKFAEFVDAVERRPQQVMTAEVVNNGACTPFMPELWQGFLGLDIPLLDVHESNQYAQLSHRFMYENWRELVTRPTSVTDLEAWLSINFIGFNWEMLCRIERRLGRRSPEMIADRPWKPGSRIGDEGAANLFPRAVMQGFTVAHLGFGPQQLTDHQEDEWREDYAEIGWEYLKAVQKLNTLGSR